MEQYKALDFLGEIGHVDDDDAVENLSKTWNDTVAILKNQVNHIQDANG